MYRRALFDDVKVRDSVWMNKDKFLSLYFKIRIKYFLNIVMDLAIKELEHLQLNTKIHNFISEEVILRLQLWTNFKKNMDCLANQ